MSFGDVLDDAMDRALLDAFASKLDVAPVEMQQRVVRHLARRQRRRRVQAGALVGIAAVAIIAIGVRGSVHNRAVQTEHTATHDGVKNGASARASATTGPSTNHETSNANPSSSGGAAAGALPAGSPSAGNHTTTDAHPGSGSGGVPTNGTPTSDVPSHDVRVELRDSGLWLSTTTAIRPYHLTFADVRSVRPADVTLALDGAYGSVASYGNPSHENGPIGPTTLRVMHAWPHTNEIQDGVAPVTIDVVAAVLAAPTEPANTITIDLHNGGWTLPHRELATDAPCVRGYGCGSSPWTSIAPGTYTVVFNNPDHIGRKIKLPDGQTVTLARNDSQVSVIVTFSNTPSRTYELRAADDSFAVSEHLYLWLT